MPPCQNFRSISASIALLNTSQLSKLSEHGIFYDCIWSFYNGRRWCFFNSKNRAEISVPVHPAPSPICQHFFFPYKTCNRIFTDLQYFFPHVRVCLYFKRLKAWSSIRWTYMKDFFWPSTKTKNKNHFFLLLRGAFLRARLWGMLALFCHEKTNQGWLFIRSRRFNQEPTLMDTENHG